MTDARQKILDIQAELDKLEKREDELLLELGRVVRICQLANPDATEPPKESGEESWCLVDRDGDWWSLQPNGYWHMHTRDRQGNPLGPVGQTSSYIEQDVRGIIERFGCSADYGRRS